MNMQSVLAEWTDHGTKILGSVTAILSGLLAIPDLVSPGHVKYWAAANVVLGVLTINRGFTNSASAAK